jgi:hypothetical protein
VPISGFISSGTLPAPSRWTSASWIVVSNRIVLTWPRDCVK